MTTGRLRSGLLIAVTTLLLAGCKEDSVSLPQPVDMSAEAVGFYCQMDLLNHDGPKGQIHLSGLQAPIFFSQVRDTIAYLNMPEQSHAVLVAYVQDMSGDVSWARPGGWIAADSAIYVTGSAMMGGMDAPEFVPFSDPVAAAAFAQTHGGVLRRFDELGSQEAAIGAVATPGPEDDSNIADRLRALAPADRTN
ncbi:nitrous oxide reductase accessory protein NosL [Pseudooceanicola sp.]|uniref:nitrous oxide reductase accessory protein NosL n=1 Tax=Pseudooceanicola sp. TaxID=1914328 RepID=UPI00262BF90C|nr:nitrous oxide reductase accessory protein NosL [Pseudooceanicola sp.]MDF1856043.1 nitrous oxide reductase accessory protein NosL [Pseudooceanicola sp.]